MKKYILIFALLLFAVSASAQKWNGFFKPVTAERFVQTKALGSNSEFVFHPTVNISATQTYFENKEIKMKAMVGAGIGVSFLHYNDINTTPYNDYGINAMALFNMTDAGKTTVSPAVTFNYQKIAAGAMYNFVDKRFAVLTTVQLTF